jgi:hypothetical protein
VDLELPLIVVAAKERAIKEKNSSMKLKVHIS